MGDTIILSEDSKILLDDQKNVYKSTAVFIYLYYEDTVEGYYKYIDEIPSEIEVYLCSSNETVLNKLLLYQERNSERVIHVWKKPNRGRDVSALLVTFRQRIMQYKYICFLHDKKEKSSKSKKDIEFWIENLWGNMLHSRQYIDSILTKLSENQNWGLLIPPRPECFHGNAWCASFQNTQKLAKDLGISVELKYEVEPKSLGTVFWCKSQALQKLFQKEWKYEEFVQEPMPADRTISHAIERIFSYAAEDAGFETNVVMNAEYAIRLSEILHKKYHTLLENVLTEYGVLSETEEYNVRKDKIRKFIEQYENIYIYGAGKKGRECLMMLVVLGKLPLGYIVSDSEKIVKKEYCGFPVKALKKMKKSANIGIIIAVGMKLKNEIIEALEEQNWESFIWF